jgi:hypothetical protein
MPRRSSVSTLGCLMLLTERLVGLEARYLG